MRFAVNFTGRDAIEVSFKVILLVFISEIAITALLDYLAVGHSQARDILDATLLALITSPSLYLLVVRPYIVASGLAREKAAALEAKEEQLRFVLQGSELGYWDWNILTNDVRRNARWGEMLGYSFGELVHTTKQWSDFIHPDDRERAWRSINDVLEGKIPAHKAEYRMLHKDGSVRWILDQANVIQRGLDGKPTRMSGTHTDITDRKKSEAVLTEGHLRLSTILDNLFAYVALLDINGVVQEINKAPLERGGYRSEDVLGQRFADAPWWSYDGNVQKQLIDAIDAAKKGQASRYDVAVRMGDDLVPLDFLIAPIYDESGKIIGLLPTAVDITKRKNLENELQRHAYLDYLTGLPNRRSFMERSEVEFSRTKRYGKTLSLLVLDIDLFKQVNDAYGHQVGDLVLKTLADIIQGVLRNVDISGRLGGEEFAILLPETGVDKAFEVAERLREVIADAEVTLPEGNRIHFTVSIGVAAFNNNEENIGMLIGEADKALYRAKQTGRNRVCT